MACAVLIWSTPFVATKVALAEVPPLMPGAARGLDTSSAVSMMNLVPIFGVLFAVLLLGEPLELLQVLGGLVVVTGVALSVREDPWGAPWEAGAKTSAGDAGPEFPAAKDRERGPDAEGGGAWGT